MNLSLLTAWLALSGCSSSNDNGNAAAGGAGSSSGVAGANAGGSGSVGDSSRLVGSFQIKLAAESSLGSANTSVVGKVYDGPTPETLVLEKVQTEGACTLTTPRAPFCATPCGGSGVCVEDDTCLAYPSARGVGTVTVNGVKTAAGASSFTMMPIANTYQPPADVALAYPPFAEGDPVTIAAAGDYFPAFSLTSKGIAPLELTWTKGGTASATVFVKLDISHHGGSKGQIECAASDTGSLSVAATLISKLLDLGVAGYPTVIVTRRAIGATAISAGRVELVVSSSVEQPVTIDGLHSCTEDEECPSAQTCQSDLTCK